MKLHFVTLKIGGITACSVEIQQTSAAVIQLHVCRIINK